MPTGNRKEYVKQQAARTPRSRNVEDSIKAHMSPDFASNGLTYGADLERKDIEEAKGHSMMMAMELNSESRRRLTKSTKYK